MTASRDSEGDPSALGVAEFTGEIVAVKARIRLLRSFDEVSHQYQGYTLVLRGEVGGAVADGFRVAIGPAAQAKHRFRIGDRLHGRAMPVERPQTEWAQFYRAAGLKLLSRGPPVQDRAADPDGGIPPPLEEYRNHGHRRLDPRTCASACASCPFGLTMATEITIDKWNPSRKQWRFETHCYGPTNCPRYRAGAPRRVLGRHGEVWIDDDVERAANDGPGPGAE
jgi:hypothetical protein